MSATDTGGFPRFSVSARTNDVVRPSIGAVWRTVNEAVFQVDQSGFTVEAVDAANAQFVGLELGVLNFEQFDVEAGRFGIDVAALRDAVKTINKSDPITLEGDPVTEEVSVIDGRSDEIIESLDMIDPEELRDAPDLPDLDWKTAVEVPADQFGRIVRASDDVATNITLGVADAGTGDGAGGELVFQTNAEGDIDEIIGYPDFEFVEEGRPDEPTASLYKLENIDQMRLGVDRPASTDIRFTFAASSFPVKMEFQIGDEPGADVTYFLAPNVAEGFDPVSELERWPIDSLALDTVDFVADMAGGRAKTLFELFTTFADEYRLLASGDGMEMRAVGPANVGLYSVEAQPRFFDSYQSVAGFPDGPVGLGARTIDEVLKKWRQSDDLEFAVDHQSRRASFKHPVFTFRDGLIDPDSIRAEPTLPSLDLTGLATASAAEYVDSVEFITEPIEQEDEDENREPPIGFVMSDDRFYMTAMDEEEPFFDQVDTTSVQGRALSVFADDFLEQSADVIPTDEGVEVEVRAGLRFPVSILTDIDDGLLQSLHLIAPRIPDDDGLGPQVRELLSDEPIDLSWVEEDEPGPEQFDALAGFPQKTIEERFREQRLTTFPIETRVTLSSLERELSIDNADEIAVPDETLDEVLATVDGSIRLDVLDGGEVVADVTFSSEDEFDVEFRNVQPDFEFRQKTADSVRMSRLTEDENNYAYVSEQSQTPSRQSVVIRAMEDPDGDGFAVFAGLKERGEPADPDTAEVVGESAITIGNAFAEMVDLIQNNSITELVELSGGTVTLSDDEVRDELEEIVQPLVDYTLEGKPGRTGSTSPFYASIIGRLNILPEANWRTDINVLKPGEEAEGYLVRYNITLEANGPGDARIDQELAQNIVGETEDREEIIDLVQIAFAQIGEFDPVFMRRERRPPPPRSPSAGPGVREGEVAEWTEFYLPAPADDIREEIRSSGLPVELTDVSGIGPTRAEQLQETGIRDMLDVVALAGTSKMTFYGQEIIDLPENPRVNLTNAAKEIWRKIIWPKRETPGPFDVEAAEAAVSEGIEEGEIEAPEGFGVTIEDTFADEVIEAGEVEEEVVAEPEEELEEEPEGVDLRIPDDEVVVAGEDVSGIIDGQLELPITVEQFTTGLGYALPDGESVMAIRDQVAQIVMNAIGPASQFNEGRRVGVAVVTDTDIVSQRELVGIRVKERLVEQFEEAEAEAEADEDVIDSEANEFDGVPLNDWEEAIEMSVIGVEVNARVEDGQLVLETGPAPDSDVEFANFEWSETRIDDVDFFLNGFMEQWEAQVKGLRFFDLEEIEPRRREARQLIPATIPRFPQTSRAEAALDEQERGESVWNLYVVPGAGENVVRAERESLSRVSSAGEFGMGPPRMFSPFFLENDEWDVVIDAIEDAEDILPIDEFEVESDVGSEPPERILVGELILDLPGYEEADFNLDAGREHLEDREPAPPPEPEVPTEEVEAEPEAIPEEGIIELPIFIKESVTGLIYDVPQGEVGLSESDEINDTLTAAIGPAEDFRDHFEAVQAQADDDEFRTRRFGTAVVTDEDIGADRDLLDVRVNEQAVQELREGVEVAEPEERFIFAATLDDEVRYFIAGGAPDDVLRQARAAAREKWGPPTNFDPIDDPTGDPSPASTAGLVRFRGDEFIEIADDPALQARREEPTFPVVHDVTLEGRPEAREINIEGVIPQPTLDRFPDERKQDDPVSLFTQELVGVISDEFRGFLDEIPRGTTIGTVTFAQDGSWEFNADAEVVEAAREAAEEEEEPEEEPEEPEAEEPPPEGEGVGAGDVRDILVDRIAGNLNYTVEGRVPGNVTTQAIAVAMDELGEASQFDAGAVVGEITFIGETVTEVDLQRGRDILAGDVSVTEEPEEIELSAGQIETIIEQATVGLEASVELVDGNPRRIQLVPDFDNEFIRPGASSKTVNIEPFDPRIPDRIGLALDQWEPMTRTLPDEEKLEINRRREALGEQFGLDLELLDVEPVEGLSAEAIEDIVTRSVAGAEVMVTVNPEANSLRIALEPVEEGLLRYERDPMEVQGQADDPESAIIETLQEWEQSVDLRTVNLDPVNDRRDAVELEFDMSLPEVGQAGEPGGEVPEHAEVLEKWLTVKEGFALTDIDEDVLIEQPGLALPVEVEGEVAEMIEESTRAEFEQGDVQLTGEVGQAVEAQRAMEGVRQVEQGLQIHYVEGISDQVHAAIAEVLDVEPENLYDGSQPSDLEGFDLFRAFTLSRSSDDQPWSVPRFAPSALFEELEPLDGDRIKVVALAAPLR